MTMKLKKEIVEFIDSNLTSDMRERGALNLDALAKKIGIKDIILAEFNNDEISGLLKKEGEDWIVYVNYTDSPKRRRFTIAHEIGHFISFLNGGESKAILEKEKEIKDFAFARGSRFTHAEVEANQIAAFLLMPEADVKSLVTEKKTIEEMANYFQVSETAIGVRLRNLEIIPFELQNDGNSAARG